MNCRRAKQLIYDYLDGVLGDSERITLERHLSGCQSCETFSTQLGNSLDLLHRAPSEKPSDNFNWQVRLRLAREKNTITEAMAAQRDIFKTWNLRFALSAVSTFVVILASGVLLWNSGLLRQPGTPPGLSSQQFASGRTGQADAAEQAVRDTAPRYYTSQPNFGLPVAVGSPGSDNGFSSGAIDQAPDRIFQNPDSLVLKSLISKKYRYRLRMLEGQVKHLQKNLRECQGEQR
jgi:anti-sigma factor RsiW